MNREKKNKFIFLAVFFLLSLFALQISLTKLVGSSVRFTLFDLIAPTTGAFIGTSGGIIAVLLAQIVNTIVHGGHFADIGSFIRLFPTLFAVLYFAKSSKLNIFIPVLAIISFNLHPVGRSAWVYSLFWLIPLFAQLKRDNLFVKSLGATFTAHAVGGMLWIWAIPLPKAIWLGLIPQVILERFVFAGGIMLSYLAGKQLIHLLNKSKLTHLNFHPTT